MKAVAIAIWALAVIQIPSAIQAWNFNRCIDQKKAHWKERGWKEDRPLAMAYSYCNGGNPL